MIKIIKHLERLNCSTAANPRYRVTFTDDTEYVTSSNCAFVYGIENVEFRDVPLQVTLTRAGRIRHLAPVATD